MWMTPIHPSFLVVQIKYYGGLLEPKFGNPIFKAMAEVIDSHRHAVYAPKLSQSQTEVNKITKSLSKDHRHRLLMNSTMTKMNVQYLIPMKPSFLSLTLIDVIPLHLPSPLSGQKKALGNENQNLPLLRHPYFLRYVHHPLNWSRSQHN